MLAIMFQYTWIITKSTNIITYIQFPDVHQHVFLIRPQYVIAILKCKLWKLFLDQINFPLLCTTFCLLVKVQIDTGVTEAPK